MPQQPSASTSAARADRGALDYGVLDAVVGYAVRRAQLRITEAFDAELGPQGITTQRFSALVLIARNPGLKQAELARAMGIAAPQATVVVDALLGLGLVERRPVAGDRRANALFTTPEGERRLPELEARVLAHDRRVADDLSEAERATLKRLLARLAAPPG